MWSHLPTPSSPGSYEVSPQPDSACGQGSAAWTPGCCSCAPVCSSGRHSTARSGPGTEETPAYCGLHRHIHQANFSFMFLTFCGEFRFYYQFFGKCPELGVWHLQGLSQWPGGSPAPLSLGPADDHSHSLKGDQIVKNKYIPRMDACFSFCSVVYNDVLVLFLIHFSIIFGFYKLESGRYCKNQN